MYRNKYPVWDSSHRWELGWGRGGQERMENKVTQVLHQYRWSPICDGTTYDFSVLQWYESNTRSVETTLCILIFSWACDLLEDPLS